MDSSNVGLSNTILVVGSHSRAIHVLVLSEGLFVRLGCKDAIVGTIFVDGETTECCFLLKRLLCKNILVRGERGLMVDKHTARSMIIEKSASTILPIGAFTTLSLGASPSDRRFILINRDTVTRF